MYAQHAELPGNIYQFAMQNAQIYVACKVGKNASSVVVLNLFSPITTYQIFDKARYHFSI